MFKSENESGGLFFKRFVDKNEKDYILEMNKTYEQHEKELEQKSASLEGDGKSDDGKTAESVITAAFEKKMERSVRFRREQRVAQYIINEEFDKAEPIIRSYVEDYNFKLILATLNTLGSGETHSAEGEAPPSSKKDYTKFIQHHNDNYNIMVGKSVLDSVTGDVKVIDSVKKDEKKITDEEKIEGSNTKAADSEVDKKLEDAVKDNKENK
jgi:hypothetical protein